MSVSMQETLAAVRKYAPSFNAQIGIILGSGLGPIADQLTNSITIPYQAIPGLHAGHVSGHASLMMLGYLNEVPVVCMKGRLHLYEGIDHDSLKTFIRIIKQLGASTLIVTGASGSLRPEVGPGELMIINDHINMNPFNPLVGPNDESIGPRFVSLENAYDADLREVLFETGKRLSIHLHEGVYISLLGPSFETPAEIRAYQQWGAHAVGMSVVPEVILARHCGMKVVGISAITNLAVGLGDQKITHDVTLQQSELTARKLIKLIPEFVKDIQKVI